MANTAKPGIVQLLRRINEGATNSQTPLGEVLRLCLRLGKMLNNKELSDWAKAESGGYESKNNLPDYRIFETEVRGTFFGIGGSSISNVSIPQAVIDEKHREALFTVYMMQPVGELEQLVSRSTDDNSISIPWSGNIILYYQRKEIYQGYALNAAWKVVTATIIAGILEVIRTRVLEFVLAIEEELGIDMMSDDNKTPLEIPSQEKINQVINMTIHGAAILLWAMWGQQTSTQPMSNPATYRG